MDFSYPEEKVKQRYRLVKIRHKDARNQLKSKAKGINRNRHVGGAQEDCC
jgi:hypothetical protein